MSTANTEITFDSTTAQNDLLDLQDLLEGLTDVIRDLSTEMEEAFSGEDSGIYTVATNVETITQSVDTLIGKMESIVALMEPQEESLFDSLLGGVDAFNSLEDARNNLEGISEAINKGLAKSGKTEEIDFNIFKALLPDTSTLAADTVGVLGKVLKGVPGVITGAFGKVGTVIHGAWDKTKDFGKTLGTLGTNIGSTAVELAKNTGEWLANAAATAGSTVAHWAQIAATTAWKGICIAATAVTTAFGAAMTFLTSPIGLVVIGITALIAIIVLLIANWDTVSAAVGRFCDWLSVGLSQFDAFVQGIFATDWTQVLGPLGNVVNALFTNMEGIWNSIKQIFDGIITFVKGVFSGDWQMAWDGIVKLFAGIWDGIVAAVKAPINIMIGYINSFLGCIVAAINGVIGLLNGIQFEIPDWDIFGDLGGKSLNLNIPTINAPQIPLLAKGAVLPANKPFLAVVGDQRHGTNVEAPLATIQEAVALCMQDVMASNLAGHEATVAVLREILEAVLGIHIGDDTVGQAVARYNAKMAIIKGGG